MHYPKIQMTELKNIPLFFVNLEKFKKLISTKADEKYKEYRETENVEQKNQINEDITDLTFESIFISEIMSIFDGCYISSYSRLYDYLIRFNINLSTKVSDLEYIISNLNPEMVSNEDIILFASGLDRIQNEYDLKIKYLAPLLSDKSRKALEKFYKEKFAYIASTLVSLDVQTNFLA